MKKKIICLLITLVFIVLSVAFAAANITNVLKPSEEILIEKINNDFCDDPMFELLKTNISDIDSREKAMVEYEKRKEYFEKGITEKQLAIAQRLSLKGGKTVEEILKSFLNKKSGISMLKEEYSAELSGVTSMLLILKNLDDDDYEKLENAIYLNKLTGESIVKALQYEDIEGVISEYKRQVASNVRQELINNGFISENYGKSEGKINFDNQVLQMTLDLGVPQEEIDKLKSEGHSIVDIYNMYITKEE